MVHLPKYERGDVGHAPSRIWQVRLGSGLMGFLTGLSTFYVFLSHSHTTRRKKTQLISRHVPLGPALTTTAGSVSPCLEGSPKTLSSFSTPGLCQYASAASQRRPWACPLQKTDLLLSTFERFFKGFESDGVTGGQQQQQQYRHGFFPMFTNHISRPRPCTGPPDNSPAAGGTKRTRHSPDPRPAA